MIKRDGFNRFVLALGTKYMPGLRPRRFQPTGGQWLRSKSGMCFLVKAEKTMQEQQLINAFMKLTAKVGAGHVVKDLIRETDTNGNPKKWTVDEIQHAIQFINQYVDQFGKQDAVGIIKVLMDKFDISTDNLNDDTSVKEISGIHGLQ